MPKVRINHSPADKLYPQSMRVLMVSRSAYQSDVRIRREAEALAAVGHEITFIGLGDGTHQDGPVWVVGLGSELRPRVARRRSSAFRALRWVLLPEYRLFAERRFAAKVLESFESLRWRPDVVHAHDYPALGPGVAIAERTGARLIYDSHEFWSGRPRRGRPEPLRRRRMRRTEGRLARRADAVIMVSDHGARLMERALGLDRVHVVRNTFPIRAGNAPALTPTGAVYAGRIAPWRDLETVFAAQCWAKFGLSLHLIGEIDDIEVPEWVDLHPHSTTEEVEGHLSLAGIGLVTMTNKISNHRIALPNKLFQSLAVGVPVVAANAPQTAEVVTRYQLGTLYEPGVVSSFEVAVENLLAHYLKYQENVRRAQPLFDWSVDASRLMDLYDELHVDPS